MTLECPDGPASRQPRNIYLHLTRACNLACHYCYFSAGNAQRNELSLQEWEKLAEEICVLKPSKVVFTGGEALLRKDLFEIAGAFHSKSEEDVPRLCLMTNGLLIDREIAGRIVQDFDEVRLSLDGPEEINDSLRGAGVFQKVLQAIRLIKDAGGNPEVSITVTSLNLPELKSFLAFLFFEKSVTQFHLAPFRPVGRGSNLNKLVCSWRDAQEAVAGFWEEQFGAAIHLRDKKVYTILGCGNCGIGSNINILPDGSVYPCHVLSDRRFYLGNVRQAKLSELIQNSTILQELEGLEMRRVLESQEVYRNKFANAICLGEIFRDAPELFEPIQDIHK